MSSKATNKDKDRWKDYWSRFIIAKRYAAIVITTTIITPTTTYGMNVRLQQQIWKIFRGGTTSEFQFCSEQHKPKGINW
ncbi:unnamed protein product [Ambrosiozyma monospora]|uniref:Unnamed protein product n=1 Tax=Ambrosiozyma monospora TaxID=43982 RepID=A0ACB5SR21_AMBMO|nr:unnamed protein product [Ambrosiozyma monospora]